MKKLCIVGEKNCSETSVSGNRDLKNVFLVNICMSECPTSFVFEPVKEIWYTGSNYGDLFISTFFFLIKSSEKSVYSFNKILHWTINFKTMSKKILRSSTILNNTIARTCDVYIFYVSLYRRYWHIIICFFKPI